MSSMTNILVSKLDKSVNFVLPNGQECRYVRRTDGYFIVYLSSHNGCNMACRFCHLTQTGQTEMTESTLEDITQQVGKVLTHYADQVNAGLEKPAKRINFNWMAKGEVLLNKTLMGQWDEMNDMMKYLASTVNVEEVKVNVSSIIPKSGIFFDSAAYATARVETTLYYSLYSTDPQFRKRWLPKAADVSKALKVIKTLQQYCKWNIVFHWAFIEGENDSEEQVADIAAMIKASGINARFNLVRYNPYSQGQGKESSQDVLEARFKQLEAVMTVQGSKIVSRVGCDVSASCGMFIDTKGN